MRASRNSTSAISQCEDADVDLLVEARRVWGGYRASGL